MDQEGFANSGLFADSQQFNAYDNLSLFQNGHDASTFNDASWGVNASEFPNPSSTPNPSQLSRAQPSVSSWQQNANHPLAAYHNQSSPYARSLNQSPVPYSQNTFNNFGAPQNFAYQSPQFDASRAPQPGNGQNFNIGSRGFGSPAPNNATITPQALEREAAFPRPPYGGNAFNQSFNQRPMHAPAKPADQIALIASIPKGAESGMFTIIEFDNLSRATLSERMGNYVNIGKEACEYDCTRSAVPSYVRRKSRNDLRALTGNNSILLSKIGKRSMKTKTISTSLGSRSFGLSNSASDGHIKYEEDYTSSDESSSDGSAYSDDDTDSPLPTKRPATPKGSVEYDTIKALWRSKRKSIDKETIRKSLVDFWDLVKTIRDRWKADSLAVTEAEAKKRLGEIPLLQSRVKDQRDMVEVAFRAAFKHGHRGIVELLSENVSLLFLCYQFLLDRFKADDVNGNLVRAILETMSTFTTLTKEKMTKTNLEKVLPRFQKKGDARTQYWVKKINVNAETATKEAATKPDQKTNGSTVPSTSNGAGPNSPSTKKPAPGAITGLKRAAITASADGSAAKKIATGSTKPDGNAPLAKTNGLVKKPISAGDAAKSFEKTPATGIAKKTVVAKSSGFFSNLQSAAKRPGTSNADRAANPTAKPVVKASSTSVPKPAFSFAETMAKIAKPKEETPAPKLEKDGPPETAEERARRLRKEARRKLHVVFKPEEDLVEIRYFTHDPEEELDHSSNQVRDLADVGGEGRMFKQQSQMMDIDDEDDAVDEAENTKDHTELSRIDFSSLDKEERQRNYTPYGGGELLPTSTERSVRDYYESNNLIVFYTDPSEIPPNPKEPADPYNGEPGEPIRHFGSPEAKYADRARIKRGQHRYSPHLSMRSNQAPPPQQAAPDIQSILASLAQTSNATVPSYSHPQQAAPPLTAPYVGVQQQPVIPPGNIDLAAILASLQSGANQQQGGGVGAPTAAPMGFAHPAQQAQMFGGADNNPEDLASIKAANPWYKTKTCRYWPGRCQKGSSCSYLHE